MVKQERKIQANTKKEMHVSSLSPTSSSSSSSSSSSCKNKTKKSKIKKYKGVRMRSWGSWVSEIRAPNQKTRIWLGSYSTAEAAARAYDIALLCLKGPKANLNFPTSSSSYSSSHHVLDLLDEKTHLSPKYIQRVAAQAANSFDYFVPSSSAVSSPSDHDQHHDDNDEHHDDNDEDGIQSLMGSFVDQHVSLMDPSSSWYDDHNGMFLFDDGAPFDYSPQLNSTTMLDEYLYEDADIPLWSFS